MSQWSEGYVADIGYTYGYYAELNPLRIQLAFLNAGLIAPNNVTACELGYGQGLSANMHAAATATEWHGTDFNPAQASFANALGRESGGNISLSDDSFAQFAQRTDLPDFDYIGMHGIWSWVSDENRHILIDFVKRKLKVGGVLYISYNALPGWSGFAPLRHLMVQHSKLMTASATPVAFKIDHALAFTDELLKTGPLFTKYNKLASDKFDAVKTQNKNYLAHEYFNQDWQPMYFADVAKLLESAKLTYACSANYFEHVEAVNLTQTQQSFLRNISDKNFRESARDYMVNQQFRKDYWVKGLRTQSPMALLQGWRELSLLLVTPAEDVPRNVAGAIGEVNLTESIYQPILQCLSDHQVHTFLEIENFLKETSISVAMLQQAIMILAGAGHVMTAQSSLQIANAKEKSARLNKYILELSRSGGELTFLASPVTGGGIYVGRFQQLFMLAVQNQCASSDDCAKYVLNILSSQNQKIIKENKTLETAEESLIELNAQAIIFLNKQLPILKALGIF